MVDEFFTKNKCDRCGETLSARTMSWFTEETICMDCKAKEQEIKKAMRGNNIEPLDFEGCGFIPSRSDWMLSK